jgi:hypothetical protein
MEAKIKGEWTSYNYAIDCSHTALEIVKQGLKEEGYEVQYLGKSKAIKIGGEVQQLKKRSLFFNIHKPEI